MEQSENVEHPSWSQPISPLGAGLIIAAIILGALWLYSVFYPDLHGLTVREKCEYWAYWSEQGFDNEIHCKADLASKRLYGQAIE